MAFVLDRSMPSLSMDILCHDKHGESDERDTKARKDIDKHCVVGEHGVSPPHHHAWPMDQIKMEILIWDNLQVGDMRRRMDDRERSQIFLSTH